MFNFVFDREHLGRPYPNLADDMDARNGYHGMGDSYPWIGPCRLLYYCQDHDYPYTVHYINHTWPDNSFYPVGISFFDYSVDYFAMMSDQVKQHLKNRALKVLFYYHEGDNPFYEKTRLDQLCQEHDLPLDSYIFISGNTQADNIKNFCYFPDHELFYWRNSVRWNGKTQSGGTIHTNLRDYNFTLLSRVHKWWRLTVVSYLHQHYMLDKSLWSYGTVDVGDLKTDNPIMTVPFKNLESYMTEFFKGAPYVCDNLDSDQHNSHYITVLEHYENSYCNLVLETLYDAEQSNGTFITEKTFKPIRHGQPFVIFGTPGTLSTLRTLGYYTFDNVIDNSYDNIIDNTQRFCATVEAVKKLNQLDLHQMYIDCHDQLLHNQQLFVGSKHARLNNLHDKLVHQLATP